jgi:aryl-alcohol dehydrogenase-like predicted oxidoreductase
VKYRKLAKTDLNVSEIGFGVWTLAAGWWGEYTDEQACNLLRCALDLGVTFFDTGDTYGNGRGETILAQAFRDRRSDVVIATKFGYDFYNDPGERRGQRERPQDFSPKFARFALEQSLKRLQTDYVDLLQLHNPRMEAFQRDDLFELLDRLKEEGRIRAYGAALGPAIGGTEHGDEAMRARPSMCTLQIIYNLLEQDPGRGFVSLASELDVSLLVRVPHSSGLLEGKYTATTTFPPGDHRSHRPREWLLDGLKKLEQLQFLHQARDQTIGQAALKWLLAEPVVASVQPNIYDHEQLHEFTAASDLPDLSPADLARVAELYENNFHLENAASRDRDNPPADTIEGRPSRPITNQSA